MIRWLIVAMMIIRFVNYIYIKVPDNAEEPWKIRISAANNFLAGDVAYYSEYLGYDRRNVLPVLLLYLRRFDNWLYPPPSDVVHEVVYFEGMVLDVYRPTGVTEPLPALLMFNDGGWMFSKRGSDEHIHKRLASFAKVAVFGYSYQRQPPDHVFPAAFEDCETVTRHLLRNAEEYNVLPGQIGVVGEVAGGNLAMAVALKLAKEPEAGVQPLAFQALFNPVLQSLDFNLSSYQQYDIGSSGFTMLSKTNALFFIASYGFGDLTYLNSFLENSHTTVLTKKKYRKYVDTNLLEEKYQTTTEQTLENFYTDYKIKKTILNPYFSPLMASDDDLIKLPKTYLAVSEYSVFRDECNILAERLRNLNHELEYKYLEGTSYALRTITLKKTQERYMQLVSFINRTLERT